MRLTDDPERIGMAADRICGIIRFMDAPPNRASRYSFGDRARKCLEEYFPRNNALSEKMRNCLRRAYAVNGPNALTMIAEAYFFLSKPGNEGIRADFDSKELLRKLDETLGGSKKISSEERRWLEKSRKLLLSSPLNK